MTSLGQDTAWRLHQLRGDRGTPVYFNGVKYFVTTEEKAGVTSGTQFIPNTTGPFEANLDPRVFRFSPDQFIPTTDINPPVMGDTISWHSRDYVVSHVSADDTHEDTHAIAVYCYWPEGPKAKAQS